MSLRSPVPASKPRLMGLYILLLLLSIAAMVGLRGCPAGKEGSIKSNAGLAADTIDVALLYSPGSYYMYADTLGGYTYDLLRHIARVEGVHIRFWPVSTLGEGEERLRSGRCDMLGAVPQSVAFNAGFAFTNPLYTDSEVLLQRLDRYGAPSVSSALDLAGKRIHIVSDCASADKLAALSHEIGDTVYIEEHTDFTPLRLVSDLEAGNLQYAIVHRLVAARAVGRNPMLCDSSPVKFTRFRVLAASSSDTLLIRKVNTWLEKASTSKYIENLRIRYSGL